MRFTDGGQYANGEAARPILINVWYPAHATTHGKPMLERSYLDIESADSRLAPFSRQLVAYEKKVITQQITGKPESSLIKDESAFLERFFETPMASIRNAHPAPERFPVVIYHSGQALP